MRAILVGVVVMVFGLGMVSYVQLGTPAALESFGVLEPGQTLELGAELGGSDTGFVRITLDAPMASARVAVLSPTGSEVYGDVVSTRQSVDYFRMGSGGTYTLQVTLVSAQPSAVAAEIGHTLSTQTMYPAIVLVAGVIIVVVSLSLRLVRYITAQPDEKTL